MLSTRINRLSTSATMAMNQKSRDLKAQGIDVIDFSVGEPDFNTPDNIKKAAIKAIENNVTFYPPAAGFPALLEAISKKLKRENNLEYKTSQIVVSCGAKNALANVILSLIDKDDEVIIPTPYWVTYSELVKLAEGKSIIVKCSFENKFKILPEQLENAITPKTKALLLCSPGNPSGVVYSKEELYEIAKIVEKHPNIFIISDEIYEHINFAGKHETIAQFDFIHDRVVIINGVSKAYAMTGWRIGYMAGPEWLAKACIKLQGQTITGATTIAQMASIEALNGDQTFVKEMNTIFKKRKDLIMNLLNEIPNIKVVEPQGAFYVFPVVNSYYGKTYNGNIIKDSNDLCMYLLEHAHVSTVPGEAFGEPSCIRISYSTSEKNIIEGMNRIKKAMAELK